MMAGRRVHRLRGVEGCNGVLVVECQLARLETVWKGSEVFTMVEVWKRRSCHP
jgi:hypothetical protein